MDQITIAAHLRLFKALAAFPDVPIEEIVAAGRLARWKKGQTILEQGLPRIGPVFVLSGILSLANWKSTDSIDLIFPIYPHDCFQLDSWQDTPCPHTVVAVSDVQALVIPTNAYKELLQRLPQLQRTLWAASSQNTETVMSVFGDYVSNSSDERLFSFLKRYMKSVDKIDAETWPWLISQGELASFIGASRPHLSTIISRLKGEGILEMTRRQLRLPIGSPIHAVPATGR